MLCGCCNTYGTRPIDSHSITTTCCGERRRWRSDWPFFHVLCVADLIHWRDQLDLRFRRLEKDIMAVKVRCPTCEKVLSAPDTARGKAVKCPGCETKVKVPAGDSTAGDATRSAARKPSAKAPAKEVAEPDSGEFLARLDLDEIADSSHGMCPKCGAVIPEDATECPKCGVD